MGSTARGSRLAARVSVRRAAYLQPMVSASAAGLALWAGGVAVAVSFYGALLYLGVRGTRIGLASARRLRAAQRERMRVAHDQRERAKPRLYDFAALAAERSQRGRDQPVVYDFAALAAERSRRRHARVVERERRRAA
jgi:hypothetical protein